MRNEGQRKVKHQHDQQHNQKYDKTDKENRTFTHTNILPEVTHSLTPDQISSTVGLVSFPVPLSWKSSTQEAWRTYHTSTHPV